MIEGQSIYSLNLNKITTGKKLASEPQKQMLTENLALFGQENLPHNLSIRTHHISTLLQISWYWKRESNLLPWEIKDVKKLAKLISLVSENQSKDNLSILLAYDKEFLPKLYREDVIGSTKAQQRQSVVSGFLTTSNYLLRAAFHPDEFVHFNNQPDGICYSCRGGINGIGEHCKALTTWENRKEELDYYYAEVLKSLSKNGVFDIKTTTGPERIAENDIKYKLLFDSNFSTVLTAEINKLAQKLQKVF